MTKSLHVQDDNQKKSAKKLLNINKLLIQQKTPKMHVQISWWKSLSTATSGNALG